MLKENFLLLHINALVILSSEVKSMSVYYKSKYLINF